MNRLFTILAVCGTLLATFAISQQAFAQASLSDEQTQRIRQNCVATQATLHQLHASDGLLRVDRGRLYENISTKLMAPLNSRITLRGLGGLRLTATTVEFDRQLDVFRTNYIEYEKSMTRTMKIDCLEEPAVFYENIQATREKRQRVYEDTQTLITLLNAYKTEFEVFTDELKAGTQ